MILGWNKRLYRRYIFPFFLAFFLDFCLLYAEDHWEKKHSDKPIVTLFYSSIVELNLDGSYKESIHWINKIQNEDAMSSGEIPIFYNQRRQTIQKIKAYIITPEKKRYRYKMIQDVDTATEGNYSDLRKKIVTMPNVVPGSTIDFRFELVTHRGVIPGHYFDMIPFYDTTPVKYQRIGISVPSGKGFFLKHLNTTHRPVITHGKNRILYQWEFSADQLYDEDLESENYTPPAIDFLPFVCISTMNDWSVFRAWFWGLFSAQITDSPEIKAEVFRITHAFKTDEEKVEALARYLHDNVRYVSFALDGHDYKPHLAAEVFRNKFGDCKDHAVLFIAMLSQLGIKAYPVLVRPEEDGDTKKLLPAPTLFNHLVVAVRVGGKLLFVDPLVTGYKLGETPYELAGNYGYILYEDRGEFIKFPHLNLEQTTRYEKERVFLKDNGSAAVSLTVLFDRPQSIAVRQMIKRATTKSRGDFFSYIENLTRGGKIIYYSVTGKNNEYGFLGMRIKTENPYYIKPMGKIMIFGNSSISLTEEFHHKTRKYPLWFPENQQTVSQSDFLIPRGFVFEYVPDDVELTSEWLAVSVHYRKESQKITREISTLYKRSFIQPSEYKVFKDFLLQVEHALNECIIIRKAY